VSAKYPSWEFLALFLDFLATLPEKVHQMAGSLCIPPTYTGSHTYLGKELGFLMVLPSLANTQSTSVLCCSGSEISGAALFKKELDLLSTITQLCIVKEALPNYQLLHIDSGPTCAFTRHFILWFH
jgi:hypothetical protein